MNYIRAYTMLHERANYVTKYILVAMGAFPINKTINVINKYDLVINLTNKSPSDLKTNCVQYSIPKGCVPNDEMLENILNKIHEYHSQNKTVYIQCEGGHGRSGFIATIYFGKLYNMNGIDSINYIQKLHDERIDRGKCRAPFPENNKQVKYIIKHLGISEGANNTR